MTNVSMRINSRSYCDDAVIINGVQGYLRQLDDFWAGKEYNSLKYNDIINRLHNAGYAVHRDDNGKHKLI